MEIRVPGREELEGSKHLWKYCFRDSDEYIAWYFARHMDDMLCAYDPSGGLSAQMAAAPVQLGLRGVSRRGRFLAGVSTAPQFRGKGVMSNFLRNAYERMLSQGVCMAALYPFDYGFYSRYGWAQCGEALVINTVLSRLPTGRSEAVTELLSDVLGREADFMSVYEAAFGEYSGRVLRGEDAFRARMEECALEDGSAALLSYEGSCEGYLFYHFEEHTFIVDEFAAATHRARLDALRYISGHSSTLSQVKLRLPADDPAWRLLSESRGDVRLEPHGMFRIIDLKAALDGLPVGDGDIALRVSDKHAPWNDGVWRLFGENGVLRAERADPCDAAEIDILPLTQWVMGAASANELIARGVQLQESAAKQMDALLQKRRVFIHEMY